MLRYKNKETANKIEKHKQILINPNENFDLVIDNSQFVFYENGQEIGRKIFKLDLLKQQINAIPYVKPLRVSEDFTHSPLEADRMTGVWLYKNHKKNLRFPKFAPLLSLYIYYNDSIPDLIDFALLYIDVYMEIVPEDEIRIDLSEFYTDTYKQYENVGNSIEYSNGFSIINKVIRYKKEYESILNIAINQLTMEQIITRIVKAYGSIVRDFYNPFIFNYYGADAYYSYYADLNGIDMILNGVPCYSYTNTKAALKFAQDKQTIRHKELRTDCGIYMKANIDKSSKDNSIHTISGDIVKSTIEISKKPDMGFVEVIY